MSNSEQIIVDNSIQVLSGGAVNGLPPARSSRALGKFDQRLALSCLRVTLKSPSSTLSLGAVQSNFAESCTIHFKSDSALRSFTSDCRALNLSEQYIELMCDFVGSIAALKGVFRCLNDKPQSYLERAVEAVRIAKHFRKLHAPFSKNSRGHYGINGELYEILLDPFMQYTCALYDSSSDLATAQINKFRLVHDWHGNLDGANHIDIGCGWGGLIGYFSSQYCTNSIGLTDTPEQGWYATRKFGANTIVDDFSALAALSKRFDLITIVGMIEHLDPERQCQLFKLASEKLSPGGGIYLQCIVRAPAWIGGDGSRFLSKYVFPGYFIDHPASIERRFSNAGLRATNSRVDSEHYGRTCGAWLENLLNQKEGIKELIGERGFRIFFSYLLGASEVFLQGRGELRRYFLRKPNSAA